MPNDLLDCTLCAQILEGSDSSLADLELTDEDTVLVTSIPMQMNPSTLGFSDQVHVGPVWCVRMPDKVRLHDANQGGGIKQPGIILCVYPYAHICTGCIPGCTSPQPVSPFGRRHISMVRALSDKTTCLQVQWVLPGWPHAAAPRRSQTA